MNYEPRYDWTGERTRRKRMRRLIAVVAVGTALSSILLKYGWGYLELV